jgi:hypothetical protein
MATAGRGSAAMPNAVTSPATPTELPVRCMVGSRPMTVPESWRGTPAMIITFSGMKHSRMPVPGQQHWPTVVTEAFRYG